MTENDNRFIGIDHAAPGAERTVYRTSTGAILEQTATTQLLEGHAKRAGLTLRAFVGTAPDGVREYLLVDGEEPIYAAPTLEAVACHIDMMALARRTNT